MTAHNERPLFLKLVEVSLYFYPPQQRDVVVADSIPAGEYEARRSSITIFFDKNA